VREQLTYLQSERFGKDEAYWLGQFDGDLPQPLTLPGRGAARGRLTSNAHLQQITLAAGEYAQLQALSSKCGATLFMTMFASVAVLLHRLSNQPDLVIGVPMIAGRADAGSAALLGYTLNLAALRCRVTGNPEFIDYLADIKRSLVGAYSHADYPFGQLLRKLNLPPDPNRRPLASVLFNLNRALSLPQFGGLTGDLVSAPVNFGAHELMVDVIQLPDRLDIKFQYNTDLFAHEDIERMLGQFKRLLSGIVADPACRVGSLPLLDDEERAQVLEQWQGAVVPAGEAHTLHALFEAQVLRDPRACAVVFGEKSLSYGELDVAANRLAHYLRAQGVGAEVRVGVCVERSLEMVVAVLGVLKAGGAYVPLDPAYPRERLAYMLEDASPAVLLTQQSLRAILPQTDIPTLYLDTQAEELAGLPATAPVVEVDGGQLAYVTYTSGSTGQPKGVMTRHGSAVNYLRFLHREYDIGVHDRVLQVPSFSFDASVRDILGCLTAGGRLRIMSEVEARNAGALAGYLREDGITALLSITPSFLEALAAQVQERQRYEEPGVAAPTDRSARVEAPGGVTSAST
jgi:non-ribosomal peptide synthetase component F